MTNRYEQEFIDMHKFFRAWYRGEVEKTEAEFRRMADICADGFYFIPVTGRVLDRDTVLKAFFDRHGTYPGYNFWIEDAIIHHQHGGITVCTFKTEEGEKRMGDQEVLTTAVFQEEPSAPNGVVFLMVQDTLVNKEN